MSGGVTLLLTDLVSLSDERVRLVSSAMPELAAVESVAGVDDVCARARTAHHVVVVAGTRTPGLAGLAERLGRVAKGGVLAVAAVDLTEDQVAALFAQGVLGMVLASAPGEELITAFRAVAAGQLFAPARYLGVLAETLAVHPANEHATRVRQMLTERELEVLVRLAVGDTNRNIAGHLGISVATVSTHVLSILRKLDVPNRTVAALCAYRSGLVRV